MFEMFPADNVKINAMKYLYFRARPGGYILPFLHEDYELEKLGEKEEIQDKDKSWKSIFLRKERTAR